MRWSDPVLHERERGPPEDIWILCATVLLRPGILNETLLTIVF